MKRRVEPRTGPSWSSRSSQEMRLRAFPQPGLGKLFYCLDSRLLSAHFPLRSCLTPQSPWRSILQVVVSYIFITILVRSQVNGPERPSPNLLSNHILVDTVLRRAVILAGRILGAGVQRFLMSATLSVWVCHGALRKLTFTARLARGFRSRCRWGLSTEGAELNSVGRVSALDSSVRLSNGLSWTLCMGLHDSGGSWR